MKARNPALMQILLGLVIVAIDINLSGFDVPFPDVLGYVLIYTGCTVLAKEQQHDFTYAQTAVVLAAIAWCFTQLRSDSGDLFSLAIALLEIVAMWFICTGIIRMALGRGRTEVAQRFDTFRKLYFAFLVVFIPVVTMLRLFAPQLRSAAPIVLVLALTGFSLLLAFLSLLYYAATEMAA